MVLDKLTDKAASVLKTLPKGKKRVDVSFILNAIKVADGLGKILLQSVPLSIPKSKTISIDTLLKESYYQSLKLEHPYVGTEHLLLAIIKIIKSSEYNKTRTELLKYNIFSPNIKAFDSNKNTPIISQFGDNLTYKVIKDLDKDIIERDVYRSLLSSLLLKESCGVLLVGEEGVGRSTLIELLARKTSSFDVPVPLVGYKIVELDILNFMTSNLNKGGLDIGIISLVEELKHIGKVILVLKNFENMFVSTAAGLSISMAYSVFKSSIENAQIKMIAKMNISLYDRIVLENENILNNFSVVEVVEPTEKETLAILTSASNTLSDFHNVKIPLDILAYTYKRAKEDLPELSFPKKGIMILDIACTEVVSKKNKVPEKYKTLVNKSFDTVSSMDSLIEKGSFDQALSKKNELKRIEDNLSNMEEGIFFNEKKLSLTKSDIEGVLDKLSSKKSFSLDISLSKLSSLKDKIAKSIIGQDEAVTKAVKSLIRSKLGLRTKKRPLGNFLFLGPTGVGKTELAKVLATSFYGNSNLIRLDMSDFGEKHNVARLVGAPPGYVGYGEGGELTSKISATPNSVVLFDEIEKAHPDVLNILLQILEEGELKDAKGQTFDFSQSVVILTSNAGTDIIHKEGIGFSLNDLSSNQIEDRLKTNLKKILKPELLNRFDDIIIFKQLTKPDQLRILELLIKEVKGVLAKQNITLTVSNVVRDFILSKGYSKEFGARALRRTLEAELLDKIAEHLLEFRERPLKVTMRVVDDTLVI